MFRDMIDANSVQVVKSYPDAMSWPIGAGISGITLDPKLGVVPHIKGLERWPDFRKAGWDGNLCYTLWAGFKIGPTWFMSGFHQFWRDRVGTGAHPLMVAGDGPLPNMPNWCSNWVDVRKGWGPLDDYVPEQGCLMAFMVTTGDARMGGDSDPGVLKMKERSQIVLVPLNPTGDFPFVDAGDEPSPLPPGPSPAPNPGPGPVPVGLYDLLSTTRDEVILMKLAQADEIERNRQFRVDIMTMMGNVGRDPLTQQIWDQLQRGFSLYGQVFKPVPKK